MSLLASIALPLVQKALLPGMGPAAGPAVQPTLPHGIDDPKQVVILLDLNYTLVADSWLKQRWGGTYESKIEKETYRRWLVDLVNPFTVLLVTVRTQRYRAQTLSRIGSLTGWQPDDAYFNPSADYRGDRVKRRYLSDLILPRYGRPPERPYFAIESLNEARRMYEQEFGIFGCPAQACRNGIPFRFT